MVGISFRTNMKKEELKNFFFANLKQKQTYLN